MNHQRPKNRFSKTLLWVTVAHVVLLLLIGFWPARKIDLPPQMTMIEMIDSVKPIPSSKGPAPTPQVATGPRLGKPDQSQPATKPKSAPPASFPKAHPEPPKIEPPSPSEKKPELPIEKSPPTPAPTPTPTELKEDFAAKDPKKETKKEPKKEPQESLKAPPQKQLEPKKTPIKINLKEVVRAGEENDSPTTNAPPSKGSKIKSDLKSSSPSDDQPSAGEIASRLGSALGKSGSGGAVQIGPLSSPGGGTGNFGTYYDLIRKQMYSAWNRPVYLAQKELSALVKITIEKDGRISNVALVSGSGIREFDESIVEAARRVGKIREPLPEGLQNEITIRFKLDD